MTNDDEFYERVVRRIGWLILALGLAGGIATAIWKGPASGLAFLIGAAISYASFRAWRRVVDALGPNAKKPNPALYALRMVAVVAGAWVIIKFLGLNLAAAAVGLLVSGAAIVLEIVYELIYAS
jgi:ATP synthase I chain